MSKAREKQFRSQWKFQVHATYVHEHMNSMIYKLR